MVIVLPIVLYSQRVFSCDQAGGVTPGLLADGGERRAFFLRFDNAERFAIHEQRVIALACGERVFSERDAATNEKSTAL